MRICPGDTIILSPGEGFISYLWSDNTDLSKLSVTRPGEYSVVAFNEWCSASDHITIEDCGNELWFPNAFTPNFDGINDQFKPVLSGDLNTYQIIIYNQWGQQLYKSNDAKKGWDGLFQGSPCPKGLYIYIADYSLVSVPTDFIQKVKRGSFTLLR
jgi:gliding motility-associated-like protein